MKFTGICLITKNVPLLTDFYTKVLGVRAVGDDTHIELITYGASITIFSVDGMERMAPQSMKRAGYGSFTIGFEVKDVDREYERLKGLEVVLVKLPES